MILINVLILWAGIIHVSCFEEQDINRLQFGIVLKRLTDFYPISSHWFHTFSLKLPDTTRQSSIFATPKSTKNGPTNWQRCLLHAVSYIGDNKKTYDSMVNQPTSNDTCHRHYRTIIHLVRRNQLALESTNQLLEKIRSLLPKQASEQENKNRNKRAPLEIFGDFGEFMFGSVSQKTYMKLKKHVKALSENQLILNKAMQKSLKDLTSFGRVVNDRIDLVVGATHKLGEELSREVNRFDEILLELEQQHQISSDLTLRYLELIAVTEQTSRELTQFANGLENLKNRRLTVDLIPLQHMKETLISIQETLTEAGTPERQYYLVHRNPESYYHSKSEFVVTRNGTYLMIGMQIPLTIYEFSFYAFEILSYPLHLPNNQKDTMYLDTQWQGIAVNEWPNYGNFSYKFLRLDPDDILQLKINREISTIKRTIQVNSQDLCLFAIYNDNPIEVRDKCHYQIHVGDMKPSIYYLGAARYYLVHIDHYELSCQTPTQDRRTQANNERFICSNTCIVNLPDSCTLLTHNYRIDHAFDVTTTENKHREQYLASVPILLKFLSDDDVRVLGGAKLYNTELRTKIPKLRFYTNPNANLLAEDTPKRLSLDRAIASIKKNEQIVGNLAESIMTGQSQINFPTFQTPSIFNKWNIIVYLLIIALIAQAIYCLYKIRIMSVALALLNPITVSAQDKGETEDADIPEFNPFATTRTTTVSNGNTSNTKLTPIDYQAIVSQGANTYWIYGIFFIILAIAAYFLYKHCLKKYCTKMHQDRPITKIAFQFSRGNHTVLIPIVSAFTSPDDIKIICHQWVNGFHLQGCIQPQLSFFWDAIIIDTFANRTMTIPQLLPVKYWDALKLHDILKFDYVVKPVFLHRGALQPVFFASNATNAINGPTYQYNDLIRRTNEAEIAEQLDLTERPMIPPRPTNLHKPLIPKPPSRSKILEPEPEQIRINNTKIDNIPNTENLDILEEPLIARVTIKHTCKACKEQQMPQPNQTIQMAVAYTKYDIPTTAEDLEFSDSMGTPDSD